MFNALILRELLERFKITVDYQDKRIKYLFDMCKAAYNMGKDSSPVGKWNNYSEINPEDGKKYFCKFIEANIPEINYGVFTYFDVPLGQWVDQDGDDGRFINVISFAEIKE